MKRAIAALVLALAVSTVVGCGSGSPTATVKSTEVKSTPATPAGK